MTKRVWVSATFCAGMILCIFGNSIFGALGVFLGLACISGGIFFLGGVFLKKSLFASSVFIGIALLVLGVLLIILCIFVPAVAFFLGGIIFLLFGTIIFIFFSRSHKLIMPLCIGCLAIGVLMIFAQAFIGWITVAFGVGLVIYSGILLLYM